MTAKRCPICQRPAARATAPFCSAACRDRDLLRWFGDGYALPGPPVDADVAGGTEAD